LSSRAATAVAGIDCDRPRPHRISTKATRIEYEMLRKPVPATFSCHGLPLWPCDKVGLAAAVPIAAPSVVNSQLPYVPYSADHRAALCTHGGNSTWPQIAPGAIRKVPFITHSKCAEAPCAYL
jgi:hypothetical protein